MPTSARNASSPAHATVSGVTSPVPARWAGMPNARSLRSWKAWIASPIGVASGSARTGPRSASASALCWLRSRSSSTFIRSSVFGVCLLERSDLSCDSQSGPGLKLEIVEQDPFVRPVLGREVRCRLRVWERDEAVRDRAVGLADDVAVAVAVSERRDQSCVRVVFAEKALDRLSQGCLLVRQRPTLRFGDLELVVAWAERVAQFALELGRGCAGQDDAGQGQGRLARDDVLWGGCFGDAGVDRRADERREHSLKGRIRAPSGVQPLLGWAGTGCQGVDQGLDLRRDSDRRTVLVQAGDQARELHERVRSRVGQRGIARAPTDGQRRAGRRLDAVVEQIDRSCWRLVALAGAFADDIVGTQVGPFFDEERRADPGVADLLVGHQQQHQVAVGLEAFAGQGGKRHRGSRDLALHVHGPATPDRAVAFDRREWLDRPLLAPCHDDVEVAEERERWPGATAAETYEEVRAIRVLGDPLAVHAGRLEVV